ncbi:MAG: hypothetical protein ACJ8EA_08780, partial [Xanthobacteraceae bacterium]
MKISFIARRGRAIRVAAGAVDPLLDVAADDDDVGYTDVSYVAMAMTTATMGTTVRVSCDASRP